MSKAFRVYFNRHREAPQVWSVDEGSQDSEINVREVRLLGVDAKTCYSPIRPADDDLSPRCWFQVQGHLRVEGGVAYLSDTPTVVS